MRRFPLFVALAAISLLSATKVRAQVPGDPGLTPSNLPIEIAARPDRTMPGGIVTLRGTTGLVGAASTVTIIVTPPGAAAPVSLAAKPGAKGEFSTTFAATRTLGEYRVAATAPDGKGRATATFRVVPPGAIPAEVGELTEALLASSAKALELVRQRLMALPVSPPREKVRAKLDGLHQQLGQAPARVAPIKQAMTRVFEERAKVPEAIPEWDEYLGELTTWKGRAQSDEERLDALATSADVAASCADLQWISDIVGLVSEAINVAQIPGDQSRGFWADKIPTGLAARKLDPGMSSAKRFALVETMKVSLGLLVAPEAWLTTLAGVVLDLGQFASNVAFDAYCVKFEGPIEGTFIGESSTRTGEHWWDYTIGLSGRIVLMYPKDTPAGQPVSLRGFIEGAGQFELRENPAVIGRLIPGVVLFHRVTSPVTPPYLAEMGSGLGGVAPHAFRLPLVGVLEGDSIRLTVQPATFDFSDLMAGHLIWVVQPLGGLWPEIIDSPVLFQKAHPIFERVIKLHPVLMVKQDGNVMVARGTFAREGTSPDGTARATTSIRVKACNPGCLPLPLGPKGKP